jgi:hypothetical protein
LPEVPTGLRRGRRTLDELAGVKVVTDWAPDGGGLWRLELDLAPADLGTAFDVPPTTRWFLRAPDGYPVGTLDILPAVSGGLLGIFPHQSVFNVPAGAPYRGAKICVATDSEGNLRRDDQAEPRSADDRLAWHVHRALAWIENASKGTLLKPGDPFELPVFRHRPGTGVIAFRESPEDLPRWMASEPVAGLADLRRLDVAGLFWVVTAFRSPKGQVLSEPAWGAGVTSKLTEARTALWLLVPDLVVRSPYAAPASWRELAEALREQGVELYDWLRGATVGLHDGKPHPLLLGFPARELVGGPTRQVHWLAADLPALERRAPDGFRGNKVGLWMASQWGTFSPDAQLPWAVSQNWHPNELQTRGRLTPGLAGARVLLIGAGAMGSVVGELLVRAGVTSMTVVDGDGLTAGNLVRHSLTLAELGMQKSIALANRLNAASPSAVVVARAARVEETVDADFLGQFDLVADATGDHAVLGMLAAVEAPRPLTYASLAITAHARLLVAHVSRGTRFPLSEFDSAYEPHARAEADRGEERPWEGLGCWHPVFPARPDQVSLMAAAAVGLLNDAWPIAEGKGALHVFERVSGEGGAFAGIRKLSP